MRRRYWRHVRLQAYREARDTVRAHWGRAVIVAVGSLITVIAVRIFGTEAAWWDDLIATGTWLALVALAFGWLFYQKLQSIPPRMHAEAIKANRLAEQELAELRRQQSEKAKPKLIFDFRPDDNKHLQQRKIERHRIIWSGQVSLRNESTATIKDVMVTMVNIASATELRSLDELLMSDRQRSTRVNINPGTPENFRVFSCRAHSAPSVIWLAPQSADGARDGERVDIGRYRIKLRADASDTPYVFEFYFLEVTVGSTPVFRPWQDDDTL
jgi:hypothetical protein